MSKIIEIKFLRHPFPGYIGLDIETKKRRYFYYSNNHSLVEFDSDKTDDNRLVALMKRENYIYEKVPSKIKKFVNDGIITHREYNNLYNFPLKYLDFNKSCLKIREFDDNYSLLFRSIAYSPITNEIEYSSSIDILYTYLIHELGHMKVTRFKIDEQSRKIYVTAGFATGTVDFEPIILSNGDIFYRIINKLSYEPTGHALEEIMNDYDCTLVLPSYEVTYPNFGRELNELCDNKLLIARYTNGLDELNNGLLSIINSKTLLDDLQEGLVSAVFKEKHGVDKVRKILNLYKNAKILK